MGKNRGRKDSSKDRTRWEYRRIIRWSRWGQRSTQFPWLQGRARLGASGGEQTQEVGRKVVLRPDVGIEGEKPRLVEKVWVVAISGLHVG